MSLRTYLRSSIFEDSEADFKILVAPGGDIQIRSLQAISGAVAFLGVPNQRAIELAVMDYGQVKGHSVSIGTPLDDLCSAEGGQAAGQTIAAFSHAGLNDRTYAYHISVAIPAEPVEGLVSYWALNETSGTTAANSVAGGTPGSLFNGATWTSDAERGRVLSLGSRGLVPPVDSRSRGAPVDAV